jgi:hypothetical protein
LHLLTGFGLPWQGGDTRWLTLKPDNYEVIGQGRPCGTPGCCLPDWHSGPHSLEKVACRSERKPKVIVRRSPRLISAPFLWHALDLDLQAMVLLQLSGDVCELLTLFARLARVIRPMRVVILRALQLNDDADGLLSSSFAASDRKLGADPSPLKGLFWGVHCAGEPSNQVDEQMRVELRLLRPKLSPRSWKWMLQLHMWSNASDCDCLQLAAVQVFYNPSERIGQLRHGARKRGHTFCERHGGVYAERNEAIQQYGICMRNMDALIYPKLTTVAENVIRLSSCGRPIFTWTLPEEAACVLKLVRAFV